MWSRRTGRNSARTDAGRVSSSSLPASSWSTARVHRAGEDGRAVCTRAPSCSGSLVEPIAGLNESASAGLLPRAAVDRGGRPRTREDLNEHARVEPGRAAPGLHAARTGDIRPFLPHEERRPIGEPAGECDPEVPGSGVPSGKAAGPGTTATRSRQSARPRRCVGDRGRPPWRGRFIRGTGAGGGRPAMPGTVRRSSPRRVRGANTRLVRASTSCR